ncbi:aquaporin-like protein [Dothidotthia symphoricarpi CBS 119687]|uniref:Aquaporin-like protein n=1 Tax=Dothidotthia symphoricarpi CBS 119687 TaxID=1392245 RepID=A0A6A6A9U9_9PLEO|nr:aquaporin-like protein [Dothidotthia symphoricarpi CBS 119687]KAF2127451.1 aquaporin-like protein [Dothidotthia symphoricarpi CBS 119687]
MDEKSSTDRSSGLPFHEPSHVPPSEDRIRYHTVRTEVNAFLGEFIGTFMFLSMSFAGTQIALNAAGTSELTADDKPDVAKLLYIAFVFGASLAVNVAIFADISGGKFNPAVTTALLVTGKIHWHRALQTIVSQMIAGIAAAGFVSGVLPGPLIIATVLDASMSITRGFFLEAFVTSQLVLTILMMEGGSAKPAYIGFALFVSELSCVFFTGGSLNPARSFGPACIVGFTGYHWIYWIGPLLGSLVASGEYYLINFIRKGTI